MAVDYQFGADTKMSVPECIKLLISQLGLKTSPIGPHPRLYDDGFRVIVTHCDDANQLVKEVCTEVFGFVPTLRISMRPVLSGPNNESGVQTMIRVVDLMLRSDSGDAGFALELEKVLLLRRNGRLYARDDFENHLNTERLAMISLPYERKALRP